MDKLIKYFKLNWPLAILLLAICTFFYQFLFYGKIPIPADTIVGMYHPWRDVVWNDYSTGVPYKNPLITDPVRQQYVWRFLAISELKNYQIPLWNPYSFSGTEHLSNFQTAVFYPLNLIFFIFSFNTAWGISVFLQMILGAIFMYLFLINKGLRHVSVLIGTLSYIFSGFWIAWLEWNTIIHTALWLPLILICIDKIFYLLGDKNIKVKDSLTIFRAIRITYKWLFIIVFSSVSSFFAGHLQTFFYISLISIFYTIHNLFQYRKNRKQVVILLIALSLIIIALTTIQWLPTIRFILESARDFDQADYRKSGFFIPFAHLIQFFVPDFFGNPTTGNYWGVWNYGEFIGYIGIIPLFFALYGGVYSVKRERWFYALVILFSFIFATDNPIAKLPYEWGIPYLASTSPARLLVLIDFSLAILSAYGLDAMLAEFSRRKILLISGIIYTLFVLCGLYLIIMGNLVSYPIMDHISTATRNMILPVVIFSFAFFIFMILMKKKNTRNIFLAMFVMISIFDHLRFGMKFTPFSLQDWIYPETKSIKYLNENIGFYRIMSLDRRIMAQNFSVKYQLQDVSGYDPLYLLSYNKFVTAWENGIRNPIPSSFNRIITPANYDSFFTDLLGVKYILSYGDIDRTDLDLVLREGQTYIYENKKKFPRVFIAESVIDKIPENEVIGKLFELNDSLRRTAIISDSLVQNLGRSGLMEDEKADILHYSPNKILIKTNTSSNRFLVLTDIYSPIWKAYIDGREEKIYKTDYIFRGIIVPKGIHNIEFKARII